MDFVNAAVPGYTVESSLQILRHRVAALQPDVIVVYHATNDFSQEVNALAIDNGLIDVRRGDGQGWLARYSLLFELVSKNLRVMAAQRGESAADAHRLAVDAALLGSDFRARLGTLLREAGDGGARVAVATFSTHLRRGQTAEQQRRATVSALVYMPFMTTSGLLDGYQRYNALIAEAAAAEDALLIGGEDSIPGNPAHFVDSVHFTDQGSRAMAVRVASALLADQQVLRRLRQLQPPRY